MPVGIPATGPRAQREQNSRLQKRMRFGNTSKKIDPYPNWWSLLPPARDLDSSMRRGVTSARNPHGAFLWVLGNDFVIQGAERKEDRPMPPGAIVVKENYARDKATLQSITVM